jgi:putative ABC transport system permease protein
MDMLWRDFCVATRQIRRQPGFALAVVCTLALTIAANIAVFSVVNAVLFRSLPCQSPDRLVWIASVRTDNPSAPFSLPEFIDYRSRTRTLSGIAAYANWTARLGGDEITEGLQGARISANAFDILGLTPAAGRLLRDSDDRPDAPNVAILSYRLWQRRFAAATAAVGSTIRLNGDSFTIVGILPSHFPIPLRDIDVVVPLVPDRDPNRYLRRSSNFLRFFGRLAPNTAPELAQAELTTICRSLKQQFPTEYTRKEAVRIASLQEALVGDFRQSMTLLFTAVLIVLAAALANLMSLVMVRANARRAEFSVRVAMGASRFHLLGQLMVESLLLALLGCCVAWGMAIWIISVMLPWVPPSIPRIAEVSVDAHVIAFAALIGAVAAVLLTAAPLSSVLAADAGEVLRSASRSAVGDPWSGHLRKVLVVGEISAALLLVLTTTVLLQNVLHLKDVPLGFHPDSVFEARISVPSTYKSPEDLARFYDRVSERLANVPGVSGVGLVSVAPLSGILSAVPFTVEGAGQQVRDMPMVNLRAASPGYLDAVGTRLLSGRALSDSDRLETPPVALVSSALAERFLNPSPLGRRLLINDNNRGPRPVQIVGVVENVRQAALDAPAAFDLYLPLRQVHPDQAGFLRNNQFWMVRAGTAPAAFRASFLSHLRAVDPDAALSAAGPMRDYVEAALGPRRFNLGLFAAFSTTGILLAVLGLYGLVSYSVSQRHREIGLRMAIGATEHDIRRMILREALVLAATGAAFALGLAAIVQPVLSSRVPEASLPVLWATAAIALLFGLVSLAAWLPARRAAHVTPMVALRGL